MILIKFKANSNPKEKQVLALKRLSSYPHIRLIDGVVKDSPVFIFQSVSLGALIQFSLAFENVKIQDFPFPHFEIEAKPISVYFKEDQNFKKKLDNISKNKKEFLSVYFKLNRKLIDSKWETVEATVVEAVGVIGDEAEAETTISEAAEDTEAEEEGAASVMTVDVVHRRIRYKLLMPPRNS
jgi:hypothetical protein